MVLRRPKPTARATIRRYPRPGAKTTTKRMSNHWMARFGFSPDDLAQVLRRSVGIDHRSDQGAGAAITQAREFAGPQIDGGVGGAQGGRVAARSNIYLVTAAVSVRRQWISLKARGASTSAPTPGHAPGLQPQTHLSQQRFHHRRPPLDARTVLPRQPGRSSSGCRR